MQLRRSRGRSIETTIGMTGNNKSLDSESLNIFILIEHEFFIGVETGELDNLKDTYATFTKTVVMLFTAATTNRRYIQH